MLSYLPFLVRGLPNLNYRYTQENDDPPLPQQKEMSKMAIAGLVLGSLGMILLLLIGWPFPIILWFIRLLRY